MPRAPQHRASASTTGAEAERVTIYLTAERRRQIRVLAAQAGCTMSELIARWIDEASAPHYIETGGGK